MSVNLCTFGSCVVTARRLMILFYAYCISRVIYVYLTIVTVMHHPVCISHTNVYSSRNVIIQYVYKNNNWMYSVAGIPLNSSLFVICICPVAMVTSFHGNHLCTVYVIPLFVTLGINVTML